MVPSPAKLMRVLTSLVDRSLDERQTAGRHEATNGRQNGQSAQSGHDRATAARPHGRRRIRGNHPHLALVDREDSHGTPRSPAE